jgi:hypothetical protein
MNDLAEIAKLSLLLETRLAEQGVIDKEKLTVLPLSPDLQQNLDGLIETEAELQALLEIGAAVRRGQTVSGAVAAAARVMLEELCQAVFTHDELLASRQYH